VAKRHFHHRRRAHAVPEIAQPAGPFSASDLATAAGKALLVRQPFAPSEPRMK